MSQWVEALAVKFDGLSSIPMTTSWKKITQVLKVVF